ncbi:MutS-related protein [Sphingomonas pollutisoli]|uniref:MutS-related protein n=1 Tax=Sphingomonas pollutisoli TaxID=3030829 RepID=UPI0023B90BA4|nr:hypothetical protein [Sphingomonas pollutisoli]
MNAFAGAMRRMREGLGRAEKHRHPLQKQARVLEAARSYCEGVSRLKADLDAGPPRSTGLRHWQRFLSDYVQSAGFQALAGEAEDVSAELVAIRYTILIRGLDVRIDPFEGQPDYGAIIVDSYARFAQGDEERFGFHIPEEQELNFIEGRILSEVARAFPSPFSALGEFASRYGAGFGDEIVVRFDREIQFYLTYLDHIAPLKSSGLSFCLPDVVAAKDVHADEAFDLALAQKLLGGEDAIVTNSFSLAGRERIIVVSGPNQGGKTTFARLFGQLHHLACLGLPVPGRAARLHLFDRILTHFEHPEVANSANGKLQDELVRMQAVLSSASGESIIIMNELFASTTFRDAKLLSERITERLVTLDLLCIWVSFIDGLSEMSDTMISMVSGVDPDDPARRTYRLDRRPADGLAYARAIAGKYGLTRVQIAERLRK